MPIQERNPTRGDQLGKQLARMVLPSARELRRAAGLSRSQFKDGIKRVDSGKGQNRTLMPLSALWPPVFAGDQAGVAVGNQAGGAGPLEPVSRPGAGPAQGQLKNVAGVV